MTQEPEQTPEEPASTLDALEEHLTEADAADAPETAEEIARQLGDALDHIDGGRGSGTF